MLKCYGNVNVSDILSVEPLFIFQMNRAEDALELAPMLHYHHSSTPDFFFISCLLSIKIDAHDAYGCFIHMDPETRHWL